MGNQKIIGSHFYLVSRLVDMGVSKNRGTPKWMVKIMENPIKMDDLVVPLFLEIPIITMIVSGKSIISHSFRVIPGPSLVNMNWPHLVDGLFGLRLM